jgi:hypothetical protein
MEVRGFVKSAMFTPDLDYGKGSALSTCGFVYRYYGDNYSFLFTYCIGAIWTCVVVMHFVLFAKEARSAQNFAYQGGGYVMFTLRLECSCCFKIAITILTASAQVAVITGFAVVYRECSHLATMVLLQEQAISALLIVYSCYKIMVPMVKPDLKPDSSARSTIS